MTLKERIKSVVGIESFSDESNTEDGYWAYSSRGYGNVEAGSHTFHEYTLTELLKSIRRDIGVCDCEDCKGVK